MKPTLGGTYMGARPFRLDAYLDEQVFRFNERREKDGPRFVNALKGADGRRLTWVALTTCSLAAPPRALDAEWRATLRSRRPRRGLRAVHPRANPRSIPEAE